MENINKHIRSSGIKVSTEGFENTKLAVNTLKKHKALLLALSAASVLTIGLVSTHKATPAQPTQPQATKTVQHTAPVKPAPVLASRGTTVSTVTPAQIKSDWIERLHKGFGASTPNLTMIYDNANKFDVNPNFSAGIAYAESDFDPTKVGPSTCYGTSRGEYMLLDSTDKDLLNISPDDAMVQPINITKGNELIHTYTQWLSGQGNPDFKDFKLADPANGFVSYKGKLIQDANGQPIPLNMLLALAYNGGPNNVLNAVTSNNGVLVMQPRSDYASFSEEQYFYLLKVSEVYTFNYKLGYNRQDIQLGNIRH